MATLKFPAVAFILLALAAFMLSGCLLKPFSSATNDTQGPQANLTQSPHANITGPAGQTNETELPAQQSPASNESEAPPQPPVQSGCAHGNPACDQDYDCINNSCIEKITCGKFGCQQGENYTNCCADCSCPGSHACSSNGCVAQVVATGITVENVAMAPISPIVLYAVPVKTIEKGVGPAFQITLKNTGTIKVSDIKAKPEVQGYTGTRIYDIGTIGPGESVVFNYTPGFNEKALSGNTTARFKLELTCAGSNQSPFITELSMKPKNFFNWAVPESVASWADSNDRSVIDMALDATLAAELRTDEQKDRAARQIFGHLQARSIQVKKTAGPCYSETLAFPAEVLKARSGDCAELAVLFAASMEAAGMKSTIIKTPDAVLAAYSRLDGSLVPLDLRALGGLNYSDAVLSGASEYSRSPSSNVAIRLEDQWNLGIKKVVSGTDAPSSRITTTTHDCRFVSGTFAVNYWFSNDGYDAGRRCINATLYNGSSIYLSKRPCVDVYLSEKKNITFEITGLPENVTLTESCWLD